MPYEAKIQNGAPGGIRTHGLQLRKLTLYPTELQALCLHWYVCKAGYYTEAQRILTIFFTSIKKPTTALCM